MATTGTIKHAFCTRCGAPLVDGACSAACTVDQTPPPGPSSRPRATPPARQPRRPRLFMAAVLVASLTLAAAALGIATQARTELDSIAALLDAAEQERADTQQRLDKATADHGALAARVRALEKDLSGQPDTAATAKTASRSVFTIVTAQGNGSGFVVRSGNGSARLVTNFHVVAETFLNGGRTVDVVRKDRTYSGRIIDVSEANDLALITVPSSLPALDVAKRRPDIGDPVLALGSPLGLGGTVTSGIVSAFRIEDGLSYLQFSAPISPGNSGGPVVDERGRVVGVAVAKLVAEGAEGLGLAIPTNRLCPALRVC
jgi:putative serine protease PepD